MRRLIIIIIIALAFSFMLNIGELPGDRIPDEDPVTAPDNQLTLLAILPLSGDAPEPGLAQQYAIRKGMVQSQTHRITLHFTDSKGDPEIAVRMLHEQMEIGKIHGLIVSGKDVSKAVAPYALEYGIPMVAIAAPIQQEEDEQRYLISFTPPVENEISTLTPFLSDYTDIAFLCPDTEEGREKATLIQQLSSGGVVRVIEYNSTAEDFSELIRPLQAMPPEIFIIDGIRRVDAIVSTIKSRGANPVILVWERGALSLRSESSTLAEGVFIIKPSVQEDHPLFSEDSEIPFKMPTGIVAEAYDAAYTLSSRISSCNGDAECIAGWYWNRGYDGALGHVQFNEKREATYGFEIRQIRNGENEIVEAITAPTRDVYILFNTGASEDWFIDDVKRGVNLALTVINSPTTAALPLATTSGIPSLFDAHVRVLYDRSPSDGATVIGRVGITPDGRTSISGLDTEPQISIGSDTKAYINGYFDILDARRNTRDENKSISLLSRGEERGSIEIVRTTASSRGYTIEADLTYQDDDEIKDTIRSLMKSSPDDPLFVSANNPQDALLILMQSQMEGYNPDSIITIGDVWKSDSFIRTAGIFSEGIITGIIYNKEVASESQTIREINTLMVRKTGREFNDISARAFTGVMMIAEAAERAENTDPAAISTALLTSRLTTEYGSLYDGTTYISQMRDGVYRVVKSGYTS